MTGDRPEFFRYGLNYGTVATVYPESWEVDLLAEGGGLVNRALVLGPRLPEISTPTRPQWVIFGHADHMQGAPVCWPIESRLPGARFRRADLVYYDEALNYRISISRQGEFAVTNTNGEAITRIRMTQEGPFIRLETPQLHATLDDQGNLVELQAANIHLGAGAAEKLVLGSTFLTWLQSFITIFNSHSHPDAGTNNNPAPTLPTILSEVSKTL